MISPKTQLFLQQLLAVDASELERLLAKKYIFAKMLTRFSNETRLALSKLDPTGNNDLFAGLETLRPRYQPLICSICNEHCKLERPNAPFKYYREDACSIECYQKTPQRAEKKALGAKLQAYTRKQTIKNIGYDPAWTDDVKAKRNKTTLERYGGIFGGSPLLKYKQEQTLLRRYGTTIPIKASRDAEARWKIGSNKAKLPEIKLKQANTCLSRYGVLSALSRPEARRARQSQQREAVIRRLNLSGLYTSRSLNVVERIYEGTGNYKRYSFECANCNNTFSEHLDNGNLPQCFICYPKSTLQNRFAEAIGTALCTSVDLNNRQLISPLELDIVLPELKIAIELNGNYWHADRTDRNYYLKKRTLALDKGYQLYHFYEDEVRNKLPLLLDMLRVKAKLAKTKLNARACKLKEVSFIDANNFLEMAHLQGPLKNHGIAYGLYHDQTLVAIACLGRSRFKSGEIELLRFVCLPGVIVRGALSRLLKAQPHSIIISYVDLRYGGYDKMPGFKILSQTIPGYYYVHETNYLKRISRLSLQKHVLVKKGGDINKTGDQLAREQGYHKLYDCGQLKLSYAK